MSGAIYGGDEIGALVIDVGAHTTKAGYAGQESPSFIVPSQVGKIQDKNEIKYIIGSNNLSYPRNQMEIKNILEDGKILDFCLYEELIDNIFTSDLRCKSSEHPLMLLEESWTSEEQRECITELFFEKFNVPAFYLMKKPVVSAFSSGKSTALIVDMGFTGTSVTPVYDGFVLQQTMKKSSLGGKVLLNKMKEELQRESIDVVPRYEVLRKGSYDEILKKRNKYIPSYLKRTESYREYVVNNEIIDLYQSICQVSTTNLQFSYFKHVPSVLYEFSSGEEHSFGSLCFTIPEILFSNEHFSENMIPIPELIHQCIQGCDIDIKQLLYSNIVLTGGLSLLLGIPERLNNSLANTSLNTKFKIISSPIPYERHYSSWIGGSILASLGTFQQKWISNLEYQEVGKSIIGKKCH